ncbi:MAG: hemolysin family protein [Bacteroidales bacterium]|nr:hemolysin family protein [Bacteroidales bacterium]MCF8454595.1 hemolysin family protein [Bacteroidales bacterium]
MTPIIIFLMLVASAFFSGMEIAFITSNKLRIEMEKKQGLFPSGIINIFSRNKSLFLATMLIGNNIALVVYGIYMAATLEPVIKILFDSGVGILIIQTIVSTLLILITAEFLPKALFRINPNFLLNLFAVPVLLFYIVFYIPAKFSFWLSRIFLIKIMRVKVSRAGAEIEFTKIDLDKLVSESQRVVEENHVEQQEIRIFQNALDFSEVKLRDCMIPRTEIMALEVNSSIELLTEKFIQTGYSRILIYKDSIDNIIGYVKSSELFKNPKSVRSKIVQVPIVPETMAANKLLEIFIADHKNMALVVDEFGGTSGIVTIEDIIEEIFGEIEDEHDKTELVDKQISETEFLFAGRVEIDQINQKYNINIPELEDINTIGGFITFHSESIPAQNELVEIDKFRFKIIKVSSTRIELVNLKILD